MIILEPSKHLPRLKTKGVESPQLVWKVLKDHAICQGISFAKGSEYKEFETANFGWICFKRDSKTPDGFTPGKFLFKW